MASILIKLDKRRANAENKYPVKIIIFNNQSNASISLSLSLPAEAWIKDGMERPIKTSYPASKVLNDQIQKNYLKVMKKVLDLDESGELVSMKAADIKKHLVSNKAQNTNDDITFYSFADSYIEGCKANKTKEAYLYTINKLKGFKKADFSFNEINLSFLRQFDDHLCESGSGINTRSIHFRNIRSIFNRAIDDELADPGLYPFRKFKIKTEQRDKECLTAEQIKTLYDYSFETESLCMARDFWMLSFFLCGINPVDLFNLKKPERDNRISFVRSKMQHSTNNPVKLLIQPEAQTIIDKYKAADDSEYLLKFESKYVSYDIFKSFLSKKVREIAKATELTGLTLYWARYSWATIADSIGIPEKTISKGLGHTDKTMAGRKYIAFDWSKVDEANRKVICYTFSS